MLQSSLGRLKAKLPELTPAQAQTSFFAGLTALGGACVVVGVALIYVPAAFIIGGVALLVAGSVRP